MVKIRLARCGRKKRPIYRIVAADSKAPRDGKFLERLGQYDPLSSEVIKDLKIDAIKKWLQQGANFSDTVKSLLKKHKFQIN